jgi:hypothetical protein
VGRQLQEVQASLRQQDYRQALRNIAQVQQSITELNVATSSSLSATEVRVLRMSESAMGSLSEMTRSIELAGQEIIDRQDIEAGGPEISDPDVDLLRPEDRPFEPPIL